MLLLQPFLFVLLPQSPDGKLIASGAIDGIINLFDLQSGGLLHTLEGKRERERGGGGGGGSGRERERSPLYSAVLPYVSGYNQKSVRFCFAGEGGEELSPLFRICGH